MEILTAILVLGTLGLIFGVGLAVASKTLAVKSDPRLEQIHGLLPGSNCGACGGAGCFGLAEEIMSGKKSANACRVASDKVREMIAAIIGQKLEKAVSRIAALHCYGGNKVKNRFHYSGLRDCVAANLLFGGEKECVYGCLGFGTCVEVCPFDAIIMTEEGIPSVDKKKCKACNRCVEICPKKLFELTPETHPVYVACSSCDTGKNTRGACSVGCISCGKCEQVCPADAIHVINNLASIDYKKCTSCQACVKACPVKTIRVRDL